MANERHFVRDDEREQPLMRTPPRGYSLVGSKATLIRLNLDQIDLCICDPSVAIMISHPPLHQHHMLRPGVIFNHTNHRLYNKLAEN
jgi:hypothetical protein